MIKEALQYIIGMGKAEIHEKNGQDWSDKKLHLLENQQLVHCVFTLYQDW